MPSRGACSPRRTSSCCEEIGRRAGIAVENARLYEERSTIARTLQRALLPPALPEIPGFALATLYRPAGRENWVGGDFYDAFPVKGGWMVVVGDVAGRGAPAASLTAYSRHVLRTAAQLHDDPLDAVALPQPPALRPSGPRALHALLRAAARARRRRGGDRDLRRPPAAVRGPPGRHAAAGRGVRLDARGLDAGGVPAHDDDARTPASSSCSTPTASPTRSARPSASARTGCRRALTDAREPDEALRRIEDGLVEFERGDQADDTCALAIARLPVATADVQLGSAA